MGCKVKASESHKKHYLITLVRKDDAALPDLDDAGQSKFCFETEAVRDSFAAALRNLSEGREWNQAPPFEGVPPETVHKQPLTISKCQKLRCNGDYVYQGTVSGKSHWRCAASGTHLLWGKQARSPKVDAGGGVSFVSDEADSHRWLLAADVSPEDGSIEGSVWAVFRDVDIKVGENVVLVDPHQHPGNCRLAPSVVSALVLETTPLRTELDIRRAAARADPQWQPDENAQKCMLCGVTEFTQLERRHHCRYCGWIVCAGCMKNSAGKELMLEVDQWVSSTGQHALQTLRRYVVTQNLPIRAI